MPQSTYSISADGFAVPVVVSPDGGELAKRLRTNQPIPAPLLVRGLIDTGSDITCLSRSLVERLGLIPIAEREAQTIGASTSVRLFEISLSVQSTWHMSSSLLLIDYLIAMDFSSEIKNVEVLVGRDVVQRFLLISNGPRLEFTLSV